MLNSCHALISPHAPLFMHLFRLSGGEIHFLPHSSTDITLLESQGKGMTGSFEVNIFFCHSKIWRIASLLMKMKVCGVPSCAWMSSLLSQAQRVGLAVTGDLLCLGFAFCFASTWVDSWGLLSVLLSQVQWFQRAREMNWGRTGERLFLENVWDLLSHHEVEDELRTGCCAQLDHLSFLCLSYDSCHWYPTGRWVSLLFKMSIKNEN